MDVIELQELLQTLEITTGFIDELDKANLLTKPLSENENEILYPNTVIDEIKHILGLQKLGYSLADITKILKVTEQTKAKKTQKTRYFTVGQVANQLNLTKRTLDFWMEKGLIRPSSTSKSGYRLFNENAVKMVSFVGDLQTIGFTLEQIKSITDTLDEDFNPTNGEIVRSTHAIQSKITDNERAIKSLRGFLKTIQKNTRGYKMEQNSSQERIDQT